MVVESHLITLIHQWWKSVWVTFLIDIIASVNDIFLWSCINKTERQLKLYQCCAVHYIYSTILIIFRQLKQNSASSNFPVGKVIFFLCLEIIYIGKCPRTSCYCWFYMLTLFIICKLKFLTFWKHPFSFPFIKFSYPHWLSLN